MYRSGVDFALVDTLFQHYFCNCSYPVEQIKTQDIQGKELLYLEKIATTVQRLWMHRIFTFGIGSVKSFVFL